MHLPQHVEAVVFDFDGLLADTESAWHRAEAAMFARRGLRFGPDDRAACTGRSCADVVALLLARFGLPAGEALAVEAELLTLVDAQAPEPPMPMPGAIGLVRMLTGRVPLGIASNSSRSALDVNLRAIGLTDCFADTVSADDVPLPKPDPASYRRAFAALGADPALGVAFEDSDTGAAAARASGAFTVTVPPAGRSTPVGHATARSLADPGLVRWAASIGVARRPVSR